MFCLFCFVLFSVTQELAIFVRGQNKQVLVPSRPLHNVGPPGRSVCAVPPAAARRSSPHPSGKLNSGGRAGWLQAEGWGSMWSQDKRALVLWRVLGSHFHKWWRRREEAPTAGLCPWCSREEMPALASLGKGVICINISNIWNRKSRIWGSHWTSVLHSPSPSYTNLLSLLFALAGPSSWSASPPFLLSLVKSHHLSSFGKDVTTSVDSSLTLFGMIDHSFFWPLKALGAHTSGPSGPKHDGWYCTSITWAAFWLQLCLIYL